MKPENEMKVLVIQIPGMNRIDERLTHSEFKATIRNKVLTPHGLAP